MTTKKCCLIPSNAAWALLRLFMGFFWFMSGWEKLGHLNGKVLTGILGSWINGAAPKVPPNPNEWYVSFLNGVVIPNADLFAKLVVYGEILLGVALFFGVITRFAAFLGIIMNANYFFAGAHTSPAVHGVNAIYIVVEVLLILVAAGQYYGLDKYLFARLFPDRSNTLVMGHRQ